VALRHPFDWARGDLVNGWIKLHRKIIDNPVFDKPELFHLFAFCIMAASHDITRVIWNGEERDIERGSFIAGRKSLSDKLKQSESKIYRNLKVLEKLNMITLKSNNRFTLINVVNYCNYQGMEIDDEQQMNNKRTTNEQQMNTIKNIRTKELKKKDIKNKDIAISTPPKNEILQIYHEILPELPQIKGWNEQRQRALNARWEEHPDLGWWKEYFNQVKGSDFLSGKVEPKDGRKPFVATLEWLINSSNMLKVIEGKYDDHKKTQSSGGYQRTEQEEAERKADIARWASMREEDDTPK